MRDFSFGVNFGRARFGILNTGLVLASLVLLGAFASESRASLEFINSTVSYPAASAEGNEDGLRDGSAGGLLYSGTLGTAFIVGNSAVTVTALGYYDGPNSSAADVAGFVGDGLNNAHQVGIWNASGSLIASATIPAGTSATLIGDFRYVNLTSPVVLSAGAEYVEGGQVTVADLSSAPGVGDVFLNDIITNGVGTDGTFSTDFSAAPNIAAFLTDGSGYTDGAFAEPNTDGGNFAYLGGNFEYTVGVPEPATISLLGVAAAASLMGRRRQSR